MTPASIASLADLLSGFKFDSNQPHPSSVQKAVYLARALQNRANQLQTPQERRQQAELDRMIHSTADKATLTQMTDQAFRSRAPHRAVDQLIHILDIQGVPRFFSPWDRTMLKGFQTFGGYVPGVAVPFVKQRMHRETANVVLPAEWEMLSKHLIARKNEGVRMNVNYLGEAILSEAEAQNRLERYLEALQRPEIEVVSVKISTIFSQIAPIARRQTIDQLCDRLELLFRAAAKGRFVHTDGREVAKFVYLDMEEYRDMRLTAESFMRTLDRPGLENVAAGIVLQAYIPDAFPVQQEINAWARQRVAEGRAPITLRIVKGANMEMERIDASLHGWPQAPYQHKIETDANFKHMLHEAMVPENLAAIRLGVASHNLFELAYGLVLAMEGNALQHVQFEMLEGMANHQRRALFEFTRNVLLYAPACLKEDFIYAIGYLIRRLDENTGPENFLRHAFRLDVGSKDWELLEAGFLQSFDKIETLSHAPRRTQDRRRPVAEVPDASRSPFKKPTAPASGGDWSFANEPDTDFSLAHHAEWAEQIVATWYPRTGDRAAEIPLWIAGQTIQEPRAMCESCDPSRPGTVIARYQQAVRQDIDTAVACAKQDPTGWRSLDRERRYAILSQVADEIRAARADLLGAAMVDGGKTFLESDPEVSEAIDFVEFYALAADAFHTLPGLSAEGRGVVVVVSPWNFPIAIPCGGIAAALAAGNTVLLKPASDTVLTAYELCQCFWHGGVPREVLQMVPCAGREVGSYLIAHDAVDAVILTGGTDTALRMLEMKPALNLLAETGGKNATIVTALADRDQAIKHVLHSAFSHAGQKCSATSLLILEAEVYDDAKFKQTLCEAVESIPVGPAYSLQTRMGPLIRPPSGDLERGLKELEPGESWAVLPHHASDNPNLHSPGVKWGVQPGSYTHQTEFFGPVIGVMRARDLDEAIHFANATGYGLTSGLESLDDREQALWQQSIRAGNLYINRGTTGAIVLRQPFGGMAKSAFGPGIKAGGPNYVAQLMMFQETDTPDGIDVTDPAIADLLKRLHAAPDQRGAGQGSGPGKIPADDLAALSAAAASYTKYHALEFARSHDHFQLVGQDNFRRYLPMREVCVRVHPDDTPFEIFARVLAAKTVGSRVTVSRPPEIDLPAVDLLDQYTETWAASIEFVEETDDELTTRIRNRQIERLRYADPSRVPRAIRQAAPEVQLYIADAPVFRHGRIELLWYVQEQSLCIDYHRYGNLGTRSDEPRAEVQ